MASKSRTQTISFWIPFVGQNKKKMGTRISFEIEPDPNQSSFYISRLSAPREHGDILVRNGGAGMNTLFNELRAKVLGEEKQLRLFFNLTHELLIIWQRFQRGMA